jgi:hypothetical protein
MEDLLGDQPVSGLVSHDLEAQLHVACDDNEPRSLQRSREMRHGTLRCSWRWMRSGQTTPGSLLTSLMITARSPFSGCSS